MTSSSSVGAPAPLAAAGAGRTARVGAVPVLLLACAAQFMLLVDDTIVNVALPSIGADLGFGASSLTWVVNAYLLTFGGLLLIGGRLADRLGPRRMFAGSLMAFALASALCGFAPSDTVLVAARGLQGIAGALLSPAALALLLREFPEGPARRRALSTWAALMGVGAAFGLLVGGALVEVADWRWIFFINLPVAAAALLCVPRVLGPDRLDGTRPAPNVGGATLATAALLAFVFTVVETHDQGWGSARTLVGFAVAAVLAAAFVATERRSSSPLLPPSLLSRRRSLAADAVVFLAAGGLLAMFFFLTLYLQRVLGLTALQTGVAFLPFSVTMGLFSAAAQRVPERIDPRLPVVVGAVVAAVGLWLMGGLAPGARYATSVLPLLVVVGAGIAAAFVPLLQVATGGAEERDGGLASGMMTACQQIGGAVGIAIAINIATSRTDDALASGLAPAAALTHGYAGAFHLMAGLMIGAAVLCAVTLRGR